MCKIDITIINRCHRLIDEILLVKLTSRVGTFIKHVICLRRYKSYSP